MAGGETAQLKSDQVHARQTFLRAVRTNGVDTIRQLLGQEGQEAIKLDDAGVLGETALMTAAQHGHVDIIKLLLTEGWSVSKKDKTGATALLYAAKKDHANAIETLIEANASVNDQDNEGRSPLTWAARHGHVNAVKMLVQHGAVVNYKDRRGPIPLIDAADGGHANVVEALIGKSSIEEKTKALSGAASSGHMEVVKEALDTTASTLTKEHLY
uniref:Uncharacterized protein n=1 Tax=Globisporangium ultimum (strain ATCC 200006 / CBS 805.95 / DAOM BR144) TaxID=431595 RepID=K3WS27_GLOUD